MGFLLFSSLSFQHATKSHDGQQPAATATSANVDASIAEEPEAEATGAAEEAVCAFGLRL